jgi:glycosyltransferase involved in cell wall biosynthesis
MALTLSRNSIDVILVGRKKNDSLPINRGYKIKRFKLWWEKGPMFYISYNLRLFFYLLFHRADILIANDLDTLSANYLISRIKRTELYYDSHEYFTEVPELNNRPRIQKIWKSIEHWILPNLKNISTVNDSIANLYGKEYNKKIVVIRNVPISLQAVEKWKSRSDLNLPESKTILLLQGAGINIGRGAEEAIQMMHYLDDALLLIIGSGDVMEKLKGMASERVRFIQKLRMEELYACSRLADIGLTLDKDISLNYRFSLPNKLFDYIHAGLPVLASNLVEVKKIVTGYNIGMIAESHDPKYLAEKVKEMRSDKKRFALWQENLKLAAADLNWEKEQHKLLEWLQIST